MDSKHLSQLRKFTRILYVCGASLLLAAMVLSMVKLPVAAYEWDDYDQNDMLEWCHCEPNGQCQTLTLPWSSIWHGHINAPGNSYHADDYMGACIVVTDEPTQDPTTDPTQEPTPDPTQEPTPDPTQEPTPEPTDEPTPEPTDEPTPEPTDEPTPEPTDEPTPEPTDEPTPEPTQDPTEDPTQDPNPPAAVLIPVTGIELQGGGILLARTLSLNLGMLFFGMAMVLQSITYRSSKKQ